MKIVLATFGSRGDVQPMMALSLALKAAGHEVLLVAPLKRHSGLSRQDAPFILWEGMLQLSSSMLWDVHNKVNNYLLNIFYLLVHCQVRDVGEASEPFG